VKNQNVILVHFGLVVKSLRLEQKLSQEELAHRSGLHRTYITDVEHGSRNISLESISKIARALGISIADLFSMIAEYSTTATAEASVSYTAETKKFEPVEIIVIEAEQSSHAVLSHTLQDWSVANRIHTFGNEREAFDFLFSNSAQKDRLANGRKLILLDLQHPQLNSIQVLEKIRSQNGTRNVPVIVMTSSSNDSKLEQCKRLGIKEYLIKPVSFPDFANMLPQMGLQWHLSMKKV